MVLGTIDEGRVDQTWVMDLVWSKSGIGPRRRMHPPGFTPAIQSSWLMLRDLSVVRQH